jgi:ribosomal protein S18 acetylase RimI-like enzyme
MHTDNVTAARILSTETTTILDSPIWNALSTRHASFAQGNGLAKSFIPDVGPLGAILEQSTSAYDALAGVVGPDGVVAMFLESEATPPPGWTSIHTDLLYQMIADGPMKLADQIESRTLTSADVPQMVALAELTEPGPFRRRTSELGHFVGVFRGGQLAAMSGERLKLEGFTEVSAVCTHPDHRGHGYARALMSEGMRGIVSRNETPFLHVRTSNLNAISLYESLGFRIRRSLHLVVLKNETLPDLVDAFETNR